MRSAASGGTRGGFGRRAARTCVLLVATLLGAHLADPRGTARGDEAASTGVPFPVDKTQLLKVEGRPYVIDGAMVIPPGVEITLQRGVRVQGVNNASLDVQGGLKAIGTQGAWVVFQNVDFSPTSTPKLDLHFDMVDLHACKFTHTDAQGLNGEFTLENSCVQRTCEFDVRVTGRFLRIFNVEFGVPCRIRCAKAVADRIPLQVAIHGSWMRDLVILGAGEVQVRNSELRNGIEVRNFSVLALDGCDCAKDVSLLQGAEDSFETASLTKMNLFGGARLILARPAGEKTKLEKVKVDKFFFGPKNGTGVTGDKEVAALIQDKGDDAAQSVEAWWSKPNDRQHALVPYAARMRVPDLK